MFYVIVKNSPYKVILYGVQGLSKPYPGYTFDLPQDFLKNCNITPNALDQKAADISIIFGSDLTFAYPQPVYKEGGFRFRREQRQPRQGSRQTAGERCTKLGPSVCIQRAGITALHSESRKPTSTIKLRIMIQFVLRFFLVTIAAGFLKACLMPKACIQFHPLAKILQELTVLA